MFHSDIDECEQGSAGCDHNCNNTVGSYFCTCMDGYELESDNHTCTGNRYITTLCTTYFPSLILHVINCTVYIHMYVCIFCLYTYVHN